VNIDRFDKKSYIYIVNNQKEESKMEQQIVSFVVAVIFSLIGGIFLPLGIGIPLDDPSLSDKEKKQGQIYNIVLYVIGVFAVLGFFLFDKYGQFTLNVLIMGK